MGHSYTVTCLAQELLEFQCVRPLQTVYSLLEDKGGLRLLEDPLLETATAEIPTGGWVGQADPAVRHPGGVWSSLRGGIKGGGGACKGGGGGHDPRGGA